MSRRSRTTSQTLVVTGFISALVCLVAPLAAQTVNCNGVAPWSATTVYMPGDRVVFEDQLYESTAVIHTVTPAAWLVSGWGTLLGTCGGGSSTVGVTLTSPADGATFQEGAPIPIAADASSSGATLTQVELRLDGSSLGVDTTAPFALTLSGAPVGAHVITAIASNSAGDTAADSVSVTVEPGGGGGGGAVEVLGSWIGGTSHAAPAGTDRLLVVTVHVEHDAAITATAAQYGGRPMSKVVERSEGTDFRALTAVFALNEAGIAAAADSQITVQLSATPARPAAFSSVFLGNVDQANPVRAAGNGATGPATVSTTPLTAADDDLAIVAATCGNTGTYSLDNGFVRALELTIPSADGVAGARSGTAGGVTPSATHSNPNRQSIVGVVVRAAGSTGGIPAPTLSALGVSTSEIDLSWNDPLSDGDGFELERAPGGSSAFATLATLGPDATSFSDLGLPAATSFRYRVRVLRGGQAGPFSNVAPAQTQGDGEASGALTCTFEPTSETATTFTGTMLLANSNTAYAWNGVTFDIYGVRFQTTSAITSMKNDNGVINFSQNDGILNVDVGFQSIVKLGDRIEITVQGNKAGNRIFPESCAVDYVRGDVVYPQYQGLPASWSKGKVNLTAGDLIADPTSYYRTTVSPQTELMILYHPSHPTQILIGEPRRLERQVNTEDGIRIHVPNPFLAMGMGFAYEYFKLNPNYLCALGTKENFTCGFLQPGSGSPGIPVDIDGQTFTWPIVIDHPDGPFQVETGNFNDVIQHYPDFFLPGSQHDDYTRVSIDPRNPNWVASPILAAISLTTTRETLYGVRAGRYSDFVAAARDPFAEMETTTFAYNRGIGLFFSNQILTTHRDEALATEDIVAELNLGGFASHVQTVRDVTRETNQETTFLYDTPLASSDVQAFLDELRSYFPNGVPSAAEWSAMTADVQRAFNVLAEHWGDGRIRYRYDFLTLLRIVEAYLPKPDNPRPTGDGWYFLVKNAQP